MWDPYRVDAEPVVLAGHAGEVWDVCSFTDAAGRVRVMSAGRDGTVRVTNLAKEVVLLTATGLEYLAVAGMLDVYLAGRPDERPSTMYLAAGSAALPALLAASGAAPGTIADAVSGLPLARAIAERMFRPGLGAVMAIYGALAGLSVGIAHGQLRRAIRTVLDSAVAGIGDRSKSRRFGPRRRERREDRRRENLAMWGGPASSFKVIVADLTADRLLLLPDDAQELGVSAADLPIDVVLAATMAPPLVPVSVHGHRLCDPTAWLQDPVGFAHRRTTVLTGDLADSAPLHVCASPLNRKEPTSGAAHDPVERRLRELRDVRRTIEARCRVLTGQRQNLSYGERISVVADGEEAARRFLLMGRAGRHRHEEDEQASSEAHVTVRAAGLRN